MEITGDLDSYILETLRYCLCTTDGNKNNLKKPRPPKLEEEIKLIFSDTYTSIDLELADKLPSGNSERDRGRRRIMWHAFDINQNGLLSYSEVESGIHLIAKLPNLFNIKPVLQLAFNIARK